MGKGKGKSRRKQKGGSGKFIPKAGPKSKIKKP